MTTKSARLNIRLPEDDLRELEAIRERTGLQSVSDVVREAIQAYLHDEISTWNADKISATLPAALMEDVEMFIASGDATDISQAATLALAGWVEEKKRYYLEGKEVLRQKVSEAVEERGAKKGMGRTAARMRVQ
ncbi:MAG: ribbon-helix-helix domain-containing protein [Thermoplasmata archaeon]|jgi:metal-responsive CopG/Arc/MetJ family transcriptional regulator|nr:ribbon-helix-helix domain-containing protein [Thermoplasmata archaeon]